MTILGLTYEKRLHPMLSILLEIFSKLQSFMNMQILLLKVPTHLQLSIVANISSSHLLKHWNYKFCTEFYLSLFIYTIRSSANMQSNILSTNFRFIGFCVFILLIIVCKSLLIWELLLTIIGFRLYKNISFWIVRRCNVRRTY